MGYGRGTASVSRPRPKIVSPTLFLPRLTLALVLPLVRLDSCTTRQKYFLPTQTGPKIELTTQTGPHWTAATRIGVTVYGGVRSARPPRLL
jgi:hypothetical protein